LNNFSKQLFNLFFRRDIFKLFVIFIANQANLKRTILSILLLVAVTATGFSYANSQSNPAINGAWTGIIKAGKAEVVLYFEVMDASGAIIIPSQKIFRHKMAKVFSSKDSVAFSFDDNLLKAQFTGRVHADSIVGAWKQGSAAIPLVIRRVPKATVTHANVDVFLGYCQQYSLHRKEVNWTVIRDSAYLIADKGADTKPPGNAVKQPVHTTADIPQLGKAVKYIFGAVHDNHASWVYDTLIQVQAGLEGLSGISPSLMQSVRKYGDSLQVVALDNKTGYIRMPMIHMTDRLQAAAKALQIKTAIATLSASNIQKWVLDLRLCGGGNLEPMLNGISEILEDGPLGGYANSEEQLIKYWGIRNGSFCQEDSAMKAPVANNVKNKLAIITGPITASAGEALAVAVSGRPGTRTFGTPSFGQVTCTNVFPLGRQGQLVMAICYYTDRNSKVDKDRVTPEEATTGNDNFEDGKQDPAIIRAVAWLNE
jgi:carboxyl-terminal processing protease